MKAEGRRTSFVGSVRDFSDGASSPREFLEACLERIEQLEPQIKAFRHLAVDSARAEADEANRRYREGRPLSPIDGCPVGIKDIIETMDMPTGFGSPAFEGHQPDRDAACVQALRQGGAVLIGKTVTTEFAIGFSGSTTNPHDPTRTPGGSSSGSAAAVAAGMVPVALGTQTNGSVLRPASYCGIIGYKGTFGALPISGIHPVSLSHDHLGVPANSLDDLWATASWMSTNVGSPGNPPLHRAGSMAPEPSKPVRLIRLHLKGWTELDTPTRGAFDRTIAEVEGREVEIVDRQSDSRVADLETLLDEQVEGSSDMLAYDMRWPFTGYIERFGSVIGTRIHEKVKRAAEISPTDYAALLASREQCQAAVRNCLESLEADGFVMPAASSIAPKGFEFTGSRTYLVYWSWLGFPAISLPLMAVDGMPFGLQVMQVGGRDGDLAALAAWLLQMRP